MQSPTDDAHHFIDTQMSPQSQDHTIHNFISNDASVEFVHKIDLHRHDAHSRFKRHQITKTTLPVNIAKIPAHFNGLPMDAQLPQTELIKKSFAGGIAKTKLTVLQTILLGLLAGIFVAMGGHASVRISYALDIQILNGEGKLIETEKASSSEKSLVLGAIFPVGLMMIVMNGAELFTGNTMAVMPGFLHGEITVRQILRNWGIVYVSNFSGALIYTYFLVKVTKLFSGSYESAISGIAEAKCAATFGVNFVKAIGCNWMVNMAILMGTSAKTTGGRLFGLWWPITAFVVMGFEHSVANMFFIPSGMMHGADVSVGQFLGKNLIPVTLGNIVGGGIVVGVGYTFIYHMPKKISIRF